MAFEVIEYVRAIEDMVYHRPGQHHSRDLRRIVDHIAKERKDSEYGVSDEFFDEVSGTLLHSRRIRVGNDEKYYPNNV